MEEVSIPNKDSIIRKRIALFMMPLLTEGGGAEKYFIELAFNLSKRGYQADIITADEKLFWKFGKLLHIFFHGNFFKKIGEGREKEIEIKKRLGRARWIKTNLSNFRKIFSEYDIIYSKNEIVDLFFLKIFSYDSLPPVIVGVHTPIKYPITKSIRSKLHNFLYFSFIYKWLIYGTKCFHVSNSSTKKIVQKYFKKKCQLINYPFSSSDVHKSAQINKSDIFFDRNKKNIIFLGRFSDQKGIDVIINIINELIKDRYLADKIQLNVFGRGEIKYEKELKKFSMKYSYINYFNHVENKFVPHILSQQNLMIAPSRWETMPFSILEAQAMGVPVIAFDIPGPKDIIKNGITGYLTNNSDEFFKIFRSFIKGEIGFDKDLITRNIDNKFNPEIIYTEMENMLKDYYE